MRFLPALLVASTIFWLSSQPVLPDFLPGFDGSDKLCHVLAYATLAATLLYGARFPAGRQAWWWALGAVLYGISDEFHQSFVPGRTPDVQDLLADSVGALGVTLLNRQMAQLFKRGAQAFGTFGAGRG